MFGPTRKGSLRFCTCFSSLPGRAEPITLQHYTVGMTFRVVIEHDPETGDYSAVCPELPGCASAGETVDEARSNIREAIELYLMPGEIDLPQDAKLFEVTVG